jgi:hypothetical protein
MSTAGIGVFLRFAKHCEPQMDNNKSRKHQALDIIVFCPIIDYKSGNKQEGGLAPGGIEVKLPFPSL